MLRKSLIVATLLLPLAVQVPASAEDSSTVDIFKLKPLTFQNLKIYYLVYLILNHCMVRFPGRNPSDYLARKPVWAIAAKNIKEEVESKHWDPRVTDGIWYNAKLRWNKVLPELIAEENATVSVLCDRLARIYGPHQPANIDKP